MPASRNPEVLAWVLKHLTALTNSSCLYWTAVRLGFKTTHDAIELELHGAAIRGEIKRVEIGGRDMFKP
jgi:hypothetical protein